MEVEHQKYLEENEISQLFVGIVESLLVNKPEKPIQSIIRFFNDMFPSEFEEIAGLRSKGDLSTMLPLSVKHIIPHCKYSAPSNRR